MTKSALKRMLDTKMDVHLGRKTIAALAPEGASEPANERLDQSRPSIDPSRMPQ